MKKYKQEFILFLIIGFNVYILFDLHKIGYIIEDKILILIYLNSIFILTEMILSGGKKK